MSARFDDKNKVELEKRVDNESRCARGTRSRGRLRIPAALAVAVAGGTMAAGAAVAGCSDTNGPPIIDAGEVNTQGNMRLDAGMEIVDAELPVDAPVDAPALADAAVDAPDDAPHT